MLKKAASCCVCVLASVMERDSLHLHGLQHQPLSLYKSHIISTFPSKGLLKAPPLSLLHSQPPPQPQPPLLPLPRRSSSCLGHSCSPAIRNGTRKTRSAPKKSNNNNNIPKKEEKKTPKTSPDTVTVSSSSNPTSKFGVAHVDNSGYVKDRVELLPGSIVFATSPPPSSLPLPSFSLRPKLSCNAVAAGATDDLRRLLRLQ